MTIQNNPELKKLTVELSHDEAAAVSDALKTAHEAAAETGKILHPILAAFHKEVRLIAEKLGLIKAE
ncbi:MAG: hypothetical protein ACHQNE_01635 [Candidatus Kapaibacterium sp.]